MRPSERAHVETGAASHIGLNRKNNEDRYGVWSFRLETARSETAVLAVVADGVGGHLAGEVAAEIAVETIYEVVAQSDGSQPVQTLQNAFILADQRIYQSAQDDPSRQGMGSTCACAWVIGDRLYTASAGDSRIYLMRSGSIRQLTIDHTWVQEAVERGALTRQQARGHPNSHVIRRFLGSKGAVTPDFRLKLQPDETDEQAKANQGTTLRPGDALLLCSDGLTDLVGDEEILSVVQSHPIQEAIDVLVALANQRGGHDNITIIGVGILEDQAETRPVPVKSTWRTPLRVGCLTALAALAAVVALLAGYYWYQSRQGPPVVSSPTPGAIQEAPQLLPDTESPPPNPTIPALISPGTSTGEAEAAHTPLPSTPLSSTLTPWPTNTPAR